MRTWTSSYLSPPLEIDSSYLQKASHSLMLSALWCRDLCMQPFHSPQWCLALIYWFFDLFCAIHLTLLGLSFLATLGFVITHISAFSSSPSEILRRPWPPLFPLLLFPLNVLFDLMKTCSPQIPIYKWPALWLMPSVTYYQQLHFLCLFGMLSLLPQLTQALVESDCEGFRVMWERSPSLHCLVPL